MSTFLVNAADVTARTAEATSAVSTAGDVGARLTTAATDQIGDIAGACARGQAGFLAETNTLAAVVGETMNNLTRFLNHAVAELERLDAAAAAAVPAAPTGTGGMVMPHA